MPPFLIMTYRMSTRDSHHKMSYLAAAYYGLCHWMRDNGEKLEGKCEERKTVAAFGVGQLKIFSSFRDIYL